VHTEDNRVVAPQGATAQSYTSHGFTNKGLARRGFTTPGFVDRDNTNQGFTTEDILWALGIWSAIICLSPMIVFYMLMVA